MKFTISISLLMASQALVFGEACRQYGQPVNITTIATAGNNTATLYTGATNAQSFSDPIPPDPNSNSLSASATIGAVDSAGMISLNGSAHATALCMGGNSNCGVSDYGTSAMVTGHIWDTITFLSPLIVNTVGISYGFMGLAGDVAGKGSDPNNYDASASIVFNMSLPAGYGTPHVFGGGGGSQNGQLLAPTLSDQLVFDMTANASAMSEIESTNYAQGVNSPGANISARFAFQFFWDGEQNVIPSFTYSTLSNQDLGLPGGTWVPNPPSGGVDCQNAQEINWSLAQGEAFTAMQIDVPNHHLYVPVSGPAGKIHVLNLDNLALAGETVEVNAHGVAVSSKYGFSSSNPVVMWDANSLRILRTIPLAAGIAPGAIVLDPVNDLVYLFDRKSPTAIIVNASNGSLAGQFALNGIAKEAVTDGKGNIYAGIQGTDGYVVDILGLSVNGALGVANQWNLGGNICSGLAMDGTNEILFATCKAMTPQKLAPMYLMAFQAGQEVPNVGIPILSEAKSAVFNPATQQLFSLQTDGTVMILKENGTTSFAVEQYLRGASAPTSLALDSRTGGVYVGSQEMKSADMATLTLYLLGGSR